MDPGEVTLGGPIEARFEDPESRAAVILRPRDWAGAYRKTVQSAVAEWRIRVPAAWDLLPSRDHRHPVRHRVARGAFHVFPGGMIEFLHPWALLGLAGAAIPVLLHLLARREPPTVVFPAVRYLITTTQEHLRRLKLQNLLLLAIRTALIAALVLAAAGRPCARSGLPTHAPSALVLIVDNSPSSGAVVAGTTRLARLQDAGRTVFSRATVEDALWLITADGVPRRGTAAGLRRQVEALPVSPYRLDLGMSVALASEVLATESKPGEVVLLSDLQASAISPAQVNVPLVVGRPDDPPPRNAGIGQSRRAQPSVHRWRKDHRVARR